MIFKGSEKFPTTSYDETKKYRSVERPSLPGMEGDPKKGKMLAYTSNNKYNASIAYAALSL